MVVEGEGSEVLRFKWGRLEIVVEEQVWLWSLMVVD